MNLTDPGLPHAENYERIQGDSINIADAAVAFIMYGWFVFTAKKYNFIF